MGPSSEITAPLPSAARAGLGKSKAGRVKVGKPDFHHLSALGRTVQSLSVVRSADPGLHTETSGMRGELAWAVPISDSLKRTSVE